MKTRTILYFPRCESELMDTTHFHHSKLFTEFGWNVQFATTEISKQDAKHFIDFWHPDGCIVNNDALPDVLFKAIPTVFTHRDSICTTPNSAIVSYDERAIARLAARELLKHHCATYIYVPEGKDEYWDILRAREFAAALKANFHEAHLFPTPKSDFRSWRYCSALANWLIHLPRPLGILAAYDLVSEVVLNACVHANIECPQEALVLGVDNNVTICERTRPTLSSISFDSNPGCDAVVNALLKLMHPHKYSSFKSIQIPPSGIVHRMSTHKFGKRDQQVLVALDFIRRNAGGRLKARDVLADFPCSRRTAERRFRMATGHSVLEEILAIRQEKVQHLRASGVKDDVIAHMCGYAARSSLHHLISNKRQPEEISEAQSRRSIRGQSSE